MRHAVTLTALLAMLVPTPSPAGAEDAPTGLRAGAAAVDVTPTEFPIRVNGNFRQQLATEAIDRLHARALVLDDGAVRLAIVVVDSCMMPRDLLDAVKRRAGEATGIAVERMLISATHTHTAPAVMGVHGTDPEPAYRELLEDRIVESIVSASAKLAPARAGWTVASCPEWIFCRRWIMRPGTAWKEPFTGRESNLAQMNPGNGNANKVRQTGPVDTAVTLLSVETRDGKPLAVLGNYSTHYAGSRQVSADYFGEFANLLREGLRARGAGDGFVGILSNGTSGDANCIDFSRGERRRFTHVEAAEGVAAIALDALQRVDYSAALPLDMVEEELTLGVRMPSADEVAAATEYLKERGATERPIETVAENYARETVLLSSMPATRTLRLQALRLGDLAITAIPCEVYGVTGLGIKRTSPFGTTMNISLANGADGYIPPPDQFELGGYTTWRARSSCLEEDAEPKIRRLVVRLLARLWERADSASSAESTRSESTR